MASSASYGIPWYRDGQRWQDRAAQYLAAYLALPQDAPQQAEFRSFREYSVVRLIFESNRFENAGVESEHETRQLILGAFPTIPEAYADFRHFLLPVGQSVERLRAVLCDDASLDCFRKRLAEWVEKPARVRLPAVTFGDRSRSYQEVAQHYVAWLLCQTAVHSFLFARALAAVARLAPDLVPAESVLLLGTFHEVLLREEVLEVVHTQLSTGLLRADAKVPPGHYRIDIRSVGEHIAFPAPELVPACMQEFVRRAGEVIGTASPWATAAEISHRLVQIHPFPDFNGRLSRLLLSMVLAAYGVPFALALKADAKGKARYQSALRRADSGKLDFFTTLIARTLVGCFEEIDVNLKLAGLQPLVA